jgi:peptidyl-prolyl cis-trans isomerase C
MRSIRISRFLFVIVSSVLAVSSGTAQETKADAKPAGKTGTVATVNGVAIPQSRLDLIMRARTAQGQPDSPDLRKNVREDLVTREIIAQEAVKKGLDKSPDLAAQLDFVKQSLLVNTYLEDYMKSHPVTEETMKAEYEKIRQQQGDTKEYKARHILVEKESEARDALAQLKKGVKFEKIASEKSKDTGSKAKGGELGWNLAGNYVKPFGDALTKLKKGQYTAEPVQTQFGWHIIRLDDERPFRFPSFEEVKPQIQQGVYAQQREKLVRELREKAKVVD